MKLNNVVKKVEKHRDTLGLAAGETVEAACTTNPRGTMTRMMARQLGGAAAVLAVGRKGGADGPEITDGGLAERFVAGQKYIVLTDRRMLQFGVSMWTGKPTSLDASWDRGDVATITVEEGRLAYPMTIVFSDGSGVQIEGAKGTDPKSLVVAMG